MKIVTIPHPALRQVSDPVKTIDKKLIKFISQLETTLEGKKNPPGVGLSAPQVAHNVRIFCTFLKHDSDKPEIRTYINPEIIRASDELTLGPDPEKPFMEGCLSIPKLWGPVPRHYWVKLNYLQLDPQTNKLIPQTKRLSSFPARVIQHELDHLNGILFTDHTLKNNLPIYEDQDGTLVEIDLPNLL